MTDIASLSFIEIDGAIAAERALLERERRETADAFTPAMMASHHRLEALEREKMHRRGSGFGRMPERRT